ncbi:LPS export ABC transporter periplasmic protein LptC [Hanstruepera neustonica]|uniref:LPS export ABC transporter periplasmic protein LptC n=1 Tax=Hanstruepera neustonica TaxID=1445657 RepID=A0A2K1E4N6_9FLAO|nr:LPS export ABC transporter periplasmic protein LptC [Hanstruepera neustonica]PNQ75223.1 LPS export ABC transporter periplasmic protein LptC [Hanstruepera neustonica]
MFRTQYQIYFSIVMALAMTMFFSCKSNLDEVNKIGISENEPIGIAENINLKYTDSGRVTANLLSPIMLDFSNRDFAYNEFPDGAHLILFDENNEQSTVTADYAIVYDKTGIIDMQGNVILASAQKDTLFAEQLYYDQGREWLFTNKPVTFRRGQDVINGKGFDSDAKFNQAEVLEIDGVITLDE